MSTLRDSDAFTFAGPENTAEASRRRNRFGVLLAATVAAAAAGFSTYALVPTADEKHARAEVEARLATWGELLELAADKPVSDRAVTAAGVDPASPSVRWMLEHAGASRAEYEPGTMEISYSVEDVQRAEDGSLHATATFGMRHRFAGEQGWDDGSFTSAVSGRVVDFGPGPEGLVLISDVADGKGHADTWANPDDTVDATDAADAHG